MSEKNRVEIHDFKDWKAGVYLIEAGCGQGKNYFVFNTLFPYAHENGKRMLVFSNRVALREQQQAQTQEKDVKLITYQSLEHDEYLETMQDTKNKVRGLMQQVSEYDYIVLDEAHYLYQDAPFNKNTETIIELIEKYRSSKIIVLLSATPDLLKKYLRIDKPYFFKADYSYIKEVQYYTKRDTLDEIISRIPEDEKIVMFADSKDRLKELHSEYPNSAYLDKSSVTVKTDAEREKQNEEPETSASSTSTSNDTKKTGWSTGGPGASKSDSSTSKNSASTTTTNSDVIANGNGKDNYGHDKFDAFVIAEKAVKEKLKSPSTAQFCTTTEATIGRNGNIWTVKGWVDAQNGYGATVRANFVVTFTFASKDTYSVALCTVS